MTRPLVARHSATHVRRRVGMRLSPPVLAGSHPLATPWGGAHLRRSEYEDVVLGQVMTAVIDLLG
ncbi:MAG TPA: hypothetical protein VIK41_16330, partial [Gemmatimonadaceae bacterium]